MIMKKILAAPLAGAKQKIARQGNFIIAAPRRLARSRDTLETSQPQLRDDLYRATAHPSVHAATVADGGKLGFAQGDVEP